jgi:hypothetical protein
MTVNRPEIHEAANIFPLAEECLAELAEDIKTNGQQVPIERIGGKIVDGRRRLLACELAGVTPRFRDVEVADPVAYVLSLNLHRRHLTTSQRAMVADRVRELYDERAKERQREGGKEAGKGRAKQVVENLPQPIDAGKGHKKNSVENLPPSSDTGKARDQAGKVMGVSGATVDCARKVRRDGVPELAKAVDEGRMSVSYAAKLVGEPEEVQKREAAMPARPRRSRVPSPEGVKESREEARVEEVAATVDPGEAACDVRSEEVAPEKPAEPGTIKVQGVGILRANEAINCLMRIPKHDALRGRGLRVVADWIRQSLRGV